MWSSIQSSADVFIQSLADPTNGFLGPVTFLTWGSSKFYSYVNYSKEEEEKEEEEEEEEEETDLQLAKRTSPSEKM